MARNWLFIANTQVLQIVTQDGTPTPEQFSIANTTYDTLAIDDSDTFKVGDTFTADAQLQHNANNWISIGWLPKDYFEVANANTNMVKASFVGNNSVIINGVTYYANT